MEKTPLLKENIWTEEKEIEVQYDPNSTFTLKERIDQQRVTQELFNFIQDLAYFVYNLDQWDEKVDEFQKKNSSPNKTVDKLGAELDALRDKLVVTKGDNYVGTGEPQLREKLNDIYGTISSYYGAPSSTQLENIAENAEVVDVEANRVEKYRELKWKE
jgi:hypothetical protein